MAGASLAGRLSDRYGRKPMLIISALLFAISAIGSAIARDLSEFFIYRLIGGFGVGMASLLSPMYIAEIAPAEIRGRFVSLNQFTIAFYATSLAPVTWVLISEIFPNRIRGLAMAVSTFFLWAACYLLTLTFPVMMDIFEGAITFWIYAAICIAGFFFIWRNIPETKGKTLEELEQLLKTREMPANI